MEHFTFESLWYSWVISQTSILQYGFFQFLAEMRAGSSLLKRRRLGSGPQKHPQVRPRVGLGPGLTQPQRKFETWEMCKSNPNPLHFFIVYLEVLMNMKQNGLAMVMTVHAQTLSYFGSQLLLNLKIWCPMLNSGIFKKAKMKNTLLIKCMIKYPFLKHLMEDVIQ